MRDRRSALAKASYLQKTACATGYEDEWGMRRPSAQGPNRRSSSPRSHIVVSRPIVERGVHVHERLVAIV
eukprot:5356787-Pyramimonas_sp.AAC.1